MVLLGVSDIALHRRLLIVASVPKGREALIGSDNYA